MGILLLIFSVTAIAVLFVSKLKIPGKQKILWAVCIIISILFLTIYLLIKGFERGRDPKMPAEELSQPVR